MSKDKYEPKVIDGGLGGELCYPVKLRRKPPHTSLNAGEIAWFPKRIAKKYELDGVGDIVAPGYNGEVLPKEGPNDSPMEEVLKQKAKESIAEGAYSKKGDGEDSEERSKTLKRKRK
jgi:hypothetical protein